MLTNKPIGQSAIPHKIIRYAWAIAKDLDANVYLFENDRQFIVTRTRPEKWPRSEVLLVSPVGTYTSVSHTQPEPEKFL